MSDKNAQFWYLNNGITMTCDSFSYQAGSRAPIVNIEVAPVGWTECSYS
jgi:hypothetical protein